MRDIDVIQHIKDLCRTALELLPSGPGSGNSLFHHQQYDSMDEYPHHSHASEDVRRLWHDLSDFFMDTVAEVHSDRTSAGSAGALPEAKRRRQKLFMTYGRGLRKNIVGQADSEAAVKAIFSSRQIQQ